MTFQQGRHLFHRAWLLEVHKQSRGACDQLLALIGKPHVPPFHSPESHIRCFVPNSIVHSTHYSTTGARVVPPCPLHHMQSRTAGGTGGTPDADGAASSASSFSSSANTAPEQLPPGTSAAASAPQSSGRDYGSISHASGLVPSGASRDVYSPVPTASWQKAAIAIGSAIGALANPARADLVAALGETTGGVAFRRMRQRMLVNSEGQEVLRDRPRVTSESVTRHLSERPRDSSSPGGPGPGPDSSPSLAGVSFGEAYARFMAERNFSADERPAVRFVDDPELAYIAARAREVHDFWHVLFDCPTTVTGELALKMVELVQTGMPMCALSVIGGPVKLSPRNRLALQNVYYPWAVRAGLQATDLMCIYYEKYFDEGLDEVRARWRITPAPRAASSGTSRGSK
eukprot:jgi/Mesen1/9237/ME000006S09237